MKWHRLTEHVFYTDHDPETDRPCIGYVRGAAFSLLLDAGNSPAHAAALQAALAEAALPLPRLIALSHAHWDHTYGLCGWDALSLAGEGTNALLREMADWTWDDAAMQRRLETGADSLFCDIHIRKEYPDRSRITVRPAALSFRGEVRVSLGGVSCVLREIPSPHAADCVAMLVPEDGVLFLGDAYCSVPVGDDWVYEKAGLGAFLAWLEGVDFTLAIKGHHPPQTKEELLAELRAEWARL